jgi:hypothetical protein
MTVGKKEHIHEYKNIFRSFLNELRGRLARSLIINKKKKEKGTMAHYSASTNFISLSLISHSLSSFAASFIRHHHYQHDFDE